MSKRTLSSAACVLALGLPALAASAPGTTAGQAAQRIDKARTALAAVAATDAPARASDRPSAHRSGNTTLTLAQSRLDQAAAAYARGEFDTASRHADRAAYLAWKAADPRKGEK